MANAIPIQAEHVVDRARREAERYKGTHGQDRPLGGYLAVIGFFCAVVVGATAVARAQGRRLPDGLSPWDAVTLTLGTHKLSRTLTKDAVTSPLRAPFLRYSRAGGPAEVNEEVRAASGVRHAIGELVACPFCLDVWIATGFTLGLVFAPRLTRLIAGAFSVLAGADLLQLAYTTAQRKA
jgi:hypothetical protein